MTHAIIHISSTRSNRCDGKVRSSNRNIFNWPVTSSIKILGLVIRLPTATSDGVSCVLFLTKGGIPAVPLYYKNKSCTLNPLSNKTK